MTITDKKAAMEAATALRLQLLANGYSPIPNRDKRTFFSGWPHVDLTEDEIRSWERRFRRDLATGLRIDAGLLPIDLDINDVDAVNAVIDAMETAVPRLGDDRVLMRRGKGYKVALFARTSEIFSRLHTRKWMRPGASPDDETACVEIFGGASSRQFGCFGPHTRLDNGEVTVSYRWEGASPAETPLAELPVFSKDECHAMINAAEHALEDLGWEPVKLSTSGENSEIRAFDLKPEMRFVIYDGRVLTRDELDEVARVEDHLRCSASWLEGPSAKRTDRCLVGIDNYGRLFVWESSSGVTHYGVEHAPSNRAIDVDRLREKLKEADEARRNKLVEGDDANHAAAKLLNLYAFCPNQQKAVVPIWARSMDDGMVLSSFRTLMLPHADELTGPRGGRQVINPVDIWSGHKKRVTVQGLRMRPDMPRPTYQDANGDVWVNTYSPPVHDATGGSADVGVRFLKHLAPNAEEHRYFSQWIAHKVRYPWIPGPALVFVARDFGTGRGTLAALLTEVIGREYVRTIPFAMVAGSTYQSQYNDWGASTLLAVVNETSDVQDGGRYQTKHNTYEHLKELVEPRAIERHFVSKSAHFKAMSFMSMILFTNNVDALPIPETDRRFAILSNGDRGTPEMWVEINAWMQDPANIAAFVDYLMTIDLSDYSPYVAPIMTEAKQLMIDASRSGLDEGLEVALRALQGDIFTPEQVVNAMRVAARTDSLTYPTPWKPAALAMVKRQCHRVGVKDGSNWKPQINGRRYPIYARTRQMAVAWRDENAHRVTIELAKNGQPDDDNGAGNIAPVDFRKLRKPNPSPS